MVEQWNVGVGESAGRPAGRPYKFVLLAVGDMDNGVSLDEGLGAIAGLKVKSGCPLARYTSMKIGGPADYFVEVENGAALSRLLSLVDRYATPVCFLGNGSN